MNHGSKLLTAREVAQLYGLSTWTVYDLARKKEIPCIRLGARRVRFPAEVLARRMGGEQRKERVG